MPKLRARANPAFTRGIAGLSTHWLPDPGNLVVYRGDLSPTKAFIHARVQATRPPLPWRSLVSRMLLDSKLHLHGYACWIEKF